jgi:hypothetical protein
MLKLTYGNSALDLHTPKYHKLGSRELRDFSIASCPTKNFERNEERRGGDMEKITDYRVSGRAHG